MSYAKSLEKRLRERRRAKSLSASGAKADGGAPDAATLEAIGVAHPNRYPKHADPAKGQVYGGVCNTTACDNRRAVFFNRGTYGLYCPVCARGQNGRDAVPVCVPVDAKPSRYEMDSMHHEFMRAYAEARAQASA